MHKNTQPLRSADVAPLHAHALGNLRFIRASIEAAGSMAIPGMVGIALGSIGLSAALLAAVPDMQSYWLQIWLAAAFVALMVGSALMTQQARKSHALYRGPARKFVLCLLPGLLSGAVLTLVLWRHELMYLLPGIWLLLYGASLIAASTLTLSLVGVMGVLLMLLGAVAFGLSLPWQNLLLGVGFGGLHLIFGALIGRQNRDG